jgi:predicted N-acetyltransferase YhbS
MHEVAEHEPPTLAELREFAAAGLAWVATDDSGPVIAYLLSTVVDGCAHVEQVSVALAVASRGIGAALIDHLGVHAVRQGQPWVTLTTFRDVPWNAPYYERLGFEVLEPNAVAPELSDLMQAESVRIPGNHPRVAMRRPSSASDRRRLAS